MATVHETKQTDGRGRLSLGADYANRTFLVEDAGDCVIIRPARVIPEAEAWLYANKETLAGLREALDQARRREFVKGSAFERALRRGRQLLNEETPSSVRDKPRRVAGKPLRSS